MKVKVNIMKSDAFSCLNLPNLTMKTWNSFREIAREEHTHTLGSTSKFALQTKNKLGGRAWDGAL